MEQKKVTEAQKRAQKKYDDEKTKNISLKFTPKTMKQYEQLKEYTDRTGKSINGFIKELLADFFENGSNREKKENMENVMPQNLNDVYSICFCSYIYDESIQYLKDNYGNDTTEKILSELYESMKEELDEVVERCGDSFEAWVDELPDRIDEEEIVLDDKKDVAKVLCYDMHSYTAI